MVEAALQPSVLFLDFDQTLCTSKSGACPKPHHAPTDREMLALVRRRLLLQRGETAEGGGQLSVCVVTRNPNAAAVAAWLEDCHGCVGVPVLVVPGKRTRKARRNDGDDSAGPICVNCTPPASIAGGGPISKADVILGVLDGGGGSLTGLFVDDSADEVSDERLVRCASLHRAHFGRP